MCEKKNFCSLCFTAHGWKKTKALLIHALPTSRVEALKQLTENEASHPLHASFVALPDGRKPGDSGKKYLIGDAAGSGVVGTGAEPVEPL